MASILEPKRAVYSWGFKAPPDGTSQYSRRPYPVKRSNLKFRRAVREEEGGSRCKEMNASRISCSGRRGFGEGEGAGAGGRERLGEDVQRMGLVASLGATEAA